MKHYVVDTQVRTGEIEKRITVVITAEDEYKAEVYALYCESHDTENLDWEEDCQGVYDLGGEFYYKIWACEEVTRTEFKILGKHLPTMTYCQEDLDVAGNYKEKI